MTRREWEAQVAWLALHQQNWQGLRATVRFEPERRALAWREMLMRSARAHKSGPRLKEHWRNHGQ